MKIIFIITTFILLIGTPTDLFAQLTAKGIVYEDLNGNDKMDPHEKGISNVAVSNGVQVVSTDSQGQYKIEVSDDTIIFVIKPFNYAFPLNTYNQPRFFYIHKPKGSPKLKYAGTPPTGDLPASINFGLLPAQTSDNFKIVVFGDPQPDERQHIEFFSKGIASELVGVQGVAFGISLGDLVNDDLDLFLPYKNAVKTIGIPWYNVMGNHDMNTDAKTDALSDETYEKHFGPATYAFNHGMVHFIVLDNILHPDPRDSKGYWGGFRKDQLKFIKNDLKWVPKDHLIVLVFHIPFREHKQYDAFRDKDRTKVFKLLKKFPHTLSLSAHTHLQRQDFFDAKDGWLQEKPHHQYNVGTTSGDWYRGRLDKKGIPIATMRDGTPKGYAFLRFSKNQYVIDYKVAGKPMDYRMRIHAPKVVQQAKWASAAILVNFFIGSERDTLLYRIDKGKWKKMYYHRTYDPVYYRQCFEWDFAEELFEGSKPSYPTRCKHLWHGSLPTDLEAGEHLIEVKALDMFGRTFVRTRNYRIVKTP